MENEVEQDNTESLLSLSETTRIIEQQINEIRYQRNQALKILRVQFTVAGILVAALTAFLSTPVFDEFPLTFTEQGFSGTLSGPLVITFSILLIMRGIIGFFRGSYVALNVLSSKPVSSIPYFKLIKKLGLLLLGREVTISSKRRPIISPRVSNLRQIYHGESKDDLLIQYIDCIEQNNQIIEDNEENLLRLYRKMAWGLTGFGFGVIILIFTLPYA